VYAPHCPDKQIEIEKISSKLYAGSMTLQEAEDDVKLLGLTLIKPPSNAPR